VLLGLCKGFFPGGAGGFKKGGPTTGAKNTIKGAKKPFLFSGKKKNPPNGFFGTETQSRVFPFGSGAWNCGKKNQKGREAHLQISQRDSVALQGGGTGEFFLVF